MCNISIIYEIMERTSQSTQGQCFERASEILLPVFAVAA